MDAVGDFVIAGASLEDHRQRVRVQRCRADGVAQGGALGAASVAATAHSRRNATGGTAPAGLFDATGHFVVAHARSNGDLELRFCRGR